MLPVRTHPCVATSDLFESHLVPPGVLKAFQCPGIVHVCELSELALWITSQECLITGIPCRRVNELISRQVRIRHLVQYTYFILIATCDFAQKALNRIEMRNKLNTN